MSESEKQVSQRSGSQSKPADPAAIESLIRDLANRDWSVLHRAYESLLTIGRPAVPQLVGALADPDDSLRWEAAKILGEIGDPTAAAALVKALGDENFGVRWLAADGLIALGREGLTPLLRALERHAGSAWLQEGANHVLRALAREGLSDLLSPVLEALRSIEPEMTVPWAAKRALEALAGTEHPRSSR